MQSLPPTIVAVATPPGHGAIGVVRLSGPEAAPIAERLVGRLPPPRVAELRRFVAADDAAIDIGLVLHFPAPHSFTGETVIELHGHGGPVVLDRLRSRCIELGAHLARPGEFSERAFLNGKLDLVQAEAIADLIDSGSVMAARAAVRSLQGVFSRRVTALTERLTALRVQVEAAIDFPEDDLDLLSDGTVTTELEALHRDLSSVLETARRGALLRDGLTAVIAGPPNAGKSSLLNFFTGSETAIVTEVPGTTRDPLREYVDLGGLPLRLIDTAGLRESTDRIESEGIRRARHEIAVADCVLLVVDDSDATDDTIGRLIATLPESSKVLIVANKIDLTGRPSGPFTAGRGRGVAVSVLTGEGLELLGQELMSVSGHIAAEDGDFTARQRHILALEATREALEASLEHLGQRLAGELVAEELRQAQQALGTVTGEFGSEELLGRIFSSFCIGK